MELNSNLPALILDDDKDRHDAFRWFYQAKGIETIHVSTVSGAIAELEKHVSGERRLGHVSLDHDLGEYGPSEYDPEKRREYTGKDVADWMAMNMAPTVTVRIHSWNIQGGAHMEATLRRAGYAVVTRPFKLSDRTGDFARSALP